MDKIIYILIIIVLAGYSCEKDEASPVRLEGVWVEKSFGKDTIDFFSPGKDPDIKWFELRRDEKISTGLYSYELFGDSISIYWMLSSCLCPHHYYFKLEGSEEEFIIGRFYDSADLQSETLEFFRLWQGGAE